MNKPSFTPGRWRYGRTLSHGLAVFSTPQVGSPEHIVAVADENEANARLIAAAPEMLDALKAAQKRLCEHCETGTMDNPRDHSPECLAAMEAIELAEGGA